MMGIRFSALLVAFLASIPYLLDLATRREYPVPPPEGAVVVTGASTGIGAHAAHSLARAGFLVFAGVRKELDGETLKAEAPTLESQENIVPIILDVTKQEQIDKAVQTVSSTLDSLGGRPLVGLVNNAGVGGSNKPVEFQSMDDLRWLFDVNFFGAIATTKAFLALLRASKGRVINISSLAGLTVAPFMTDYCASKWALEAFSDALRVEMGELGVSVSVVEPAYVTSAIFGKIATRVKETADSVSEKVMEVYGHLVQNPTYTRRCIEKASPPTVTSDAILHALTAKHPQTRYVVANVDGLSAKVIGWMIWMFNDRIKDKLIEISRLRQRKAQ
ncbi:3-hydroxybutyrate dehydrogenase [Nannochloropsis gaditana CCMP526]|uniref:3-hydroxybutyrate dehydrogenase n=1 Tax=Nannochloropsis gaditana (strain CCMP526) TaxID=1093141 RepID=UPI00029F7425|nr:3-hydroxybutyrate dehydrogenase [Nannochloropsis gaditana CCMP526]EKU22812.1 3-hydroxybutyrate dehydrogenase [Nannochloropsis gaditana CCMP526]|eukprot:XP_005853543.1 3-hydroxybutyrate dehydrogenase [Nannochloropsis gaditana CCMP526]